MNLLVSDFDGSFFDDNYKENINLIKKINNYDFVIATGRNYKSLKKDLKIKCEYYICNDGGYILNNKKRIIYTNNFNDDVIKLIYERLKNLDYNDYFFDYILNQSKKLKSEVNKLSIRIKDNNAIKDMKYLIDSVDSVYAYLSENWINILPINSNKETAIDFLLKDNTYEKIITIGNDENDKGMIKKFNGYLITNKKIKNGIKSFIDLKNIL